MKKLVFFVICCLFISIGTYGYEVPITGRVTLVNSIKNKEVKLPSGMKFNRVLKNGDVGKQLEEVVMNLDKLVERNDKNIEYAFVSDDYDLDTIENKNLWKDLNIKDSVNILYTSEGKLAEAEDLGVEESDMFRTDIKLEENKFILKFKGNIEKPSEYSMRGNLYVKINDPIY